MTNELLLFSSPAGRFLQTVRQRSLQTAHFAGLHGGVFAQAAFALRALLRQNVPSVSVVVAELSSTRLLESLRGRLSGLHLRHGRQSLQLLFRGFLRHPSRAYAYVLGFKKSIICHCFYSNIKRNSIGCSFIIHSSLAAGYLLFHAGGRGTLGGASAWLAALAFGCQNRDDVASH